MSWKNDVRHTYVIGNLKELIREINNYNLHIQFKKKKQLDRKRGDITLSSISLKCQKNNGILNVYTRINSMRSWTEYERLPSNDMKMIIEDLNTVVGKKDVYTLVTGKYG